MSQRGYFPPRQPQQRHPGTQSAQQTQYQPPQYQQAQYQQYQQAQYQQPQQYQQYQQPAYYEAPEAVGFFKRRNNLLLASAIVAVLALVLVLSNFASILNAPPAADEFEQAAYEIGTSIGIIAQMPFLIVAFIGTVFNWLAWFMGKKGFALTAAILFCVAVPLGVGNGLPYIICIVLAFMGYAKLKKAEFTR